jgi:photosystem II stability/assembly factor-like uncharacterized protein
MIFTDRPSRLRRGALPGILALTLPLLLAAAPQAVKDSAEAKLRLQKFEVHRQMRSASPFKDANWTFVGPLHMTGRIVDVAAEASQPNVVYAAAAVGGVFKSTDDGANWAPIFEDFPSACIGDIALAPSDPRIVWVGTGEANIFRSSMAGTGIYKSVDGGASFQYMGLADTQHIARILVHPKDPDIVYVASPGHEYTFSPDRGVYKTTDGGKTWKKIFYKDEKTGVIDLAMDPSDPNVLYAGTAERLRYRWNDPKEGPQSGIYKTVNGGKTWKPLTKGLPDFAKGDCERIGLDICRTRPNTVYAVINSKGAHIYRSDDKGETWKPIEGNDKIKGEFPGYGWVFGQVRVDPADPDTIYILGLGFQRSRDGGKTWERLRGTHVDYHGMWIDPTDSKHMLVCNDGGIMISRDFFATHHHPANIPIGQLFNADVTQTAQRFYIYSNIQDHGSWRGKVDLGAGRDKISWTKWEGAPGDESGRHAVDPTDPNLVYGVRRYGSGPYKADYWDLDPKNNEVREKTIAPDFGGEKKRAQWVSPVIVSPHDPARLLYGAQFVFLTDDRGKGWRKISPDLTNFDPAKQGNIAYSTIFSLSESPVKKGLIYAGTDDGNLHVTRDEGASWTKISGGFPPDRFIAWVTASRFDEGTVYAVVNGKRHDDFNTYVYRSADFGATWTDIAAGVPGGIANVIKEDPADKDLLYLGTDLAVYVSTDGGKTWDVLGGGLPTVFVHDIVVQVPENLLVIGTHGRGAWVLDLLPVRSIAKK